MATILGPDGKPIRRAELSRPIAMATTVAVRQAWDVRDIASGITPETLATTLRAADAGDANAQLTLAEQMEEREPHLRSVLGTRKRAVLRLPITVEAVSDSPADRRIAEEVEGLTKGPGVRKMLASCLDAILKGYAVIEIRWDTSSSPWVPRDGYVDGRLRRAYQWIDPRWFRYDRETGLELRLLDETNLVDGIPLQPYRFIVHEPQLKSGLQVRAGLARVASVAYMAKSYGLKDWLAFAEVYGLPLRLGKYGAGANEDDVATLVTAVSNIGSDAAAVVPETMAIDFVQTSASASGDLFERLANWTDRQTSKLVLGQTASSDGTPGSLGNETLRADVRDDIRDADAEELEETVTRDLVGAYVALNHGQVDALPQLRIRALEPEDTKAIADATAVYLPHGLRIRAAEVRDRLGWGAPQEGDEILGEIVPPEPSGQVPPGLNAVQRCPNCGGTASALNAVLPPAEAALDALDGTLAPEQLQSMMDAMLAPILRVLEQDGPQATLEQLHELYPQMDDSQARDLLRRWIYVSLMVGQADGSG